MTRRHDVRVVPSVFRRPGVEGDFAWMIEQPAYARALFVFNDNEAQFDAFVRGEASGFLPGGGNAVIRPYRRETPPRAAGIPTGRGDERPRPGYRTLAECQAKLDEALAVIDDLLASGDYDTLVVSRSSEGPWLGSGIFDPAREVLTYISDRLCALGRVETAP